MIVCVRRSSGIRPLSRDRRHSITNAGASWSLHSLISLAGILSGPGAEFSPSSFIALITSSSLKLMSLKSGTSVVSCCGWFLSPLSGLLKAVFY